MTCSDPHDRRKDTHMGFGGVRPRPRRLLARSMTRCVLPLLLVALNLLAQDRPVEVETYRTGAWFAPRNDAEREMYLKGGFTMAPYSSNIAEWAVEQDMVFIGSVTSSGLPAAVARPFQSADGTESLSVGLFTHINFNADSVDAWWQQQVPERVLAMPLAEHVQFWKVHNEFGYHSGGIYDYSPGSIERYRRWLDERYESVEVLNARWETDYGSVEDVDPPRTREQMQGELANWLEWRRFTCWNFADYFRRTGDLIRKVVPGAAVSDNLYTTDPIRGWDNFEIARQTDYLAYDIYSAGRWAQLLELLEHARNGAAAWDKPFIMMEYHAGPNHWITEVRRRHLIIEAFAALARECRAIQWFRWIPASSGREQGIHGMMDMQGRPTERFTAAAEVSAFTRRLAPLLLRSRTQSPIALLTSSDASYLAHARGTSPWESRRRWDHLAGVLAAAGMQCDQIDPRVLEQGDVNAYDVLIAGHLEILSNRALGRLNEFAAAGGTVILHPDTALLNAYGLPRQDSVYTRDTVADGPWEARERAAGPAGIVVRQAGRGRIIQCPWQMPLDRPTGETLEAMRASYAQLLSAQAELVPVWQTDGKALSEDLDVRVLPAGTGTLVFATWMGEGSTTVTLTLPRLTEPFRAYYLRPDSAAVKPLATRAGPNGLRLESITLDPAAAILIADRPWQPLVGIDAPKTLHAGSDVGVHVTLDNLGSEPVSGDLELLVPDDWQVQALNGTSFSGIPGGGRAMARFRVSVPADVANDRFAIDYPLRAKATLTQGRTGVLTATHLPFVMPALDLRVAYEGHSLNPWQELTPPVLRWGWDREVHIPPPPPVSCAVPCPLNATLSVAPGLLEQTLTFTIGGMEGATVTPAEVPLNFTETKAALLVVLPKQGAFTLDAAVGEHRVSVPLTAGVHTETVAAAARMPLADFPSTWRHLATIGVGVRAAPARGVPVVVQLPGALSDADTLRVVDRAGQPVAFHLAEESMTLAVDAAADSTTALALGRVPDAEVPPPVTRRLRIDRPDGRTIRIRGDHYTISFDTDYGVVRWMEVSGEKALVHRTGLVATAVEGEHYVPGTGEVVEAMALASSRVAADLRFVRRQRELRIQEDWHLEAGRIDVALRVTHVGRAPLRFDGLDVEIGVNPDVLTHWRRDFDDGRSESGELPQGFGPARGVTMVSFTNSSGTAGIALGLGRCALMTKWQSGFHGVRHSAARTAVGLLRGIRLDPGDAVLAEVTLVPQTDGPVTTRRPVVVTSWHAAARPANGDAEPPPQP